VPEGVLNTITDDYSEIKASEVPPTTTRPESATNDQTASTTRDSKSLAASEEPGRRWMLPAVIAMVSISIVLLALTARRAKNNAI